VRVNRAVRRDPESPVRLETDRIEVDGVPLAGSRKLYLMFNKPRGLVTTASDEQGRDTVYSCLPEGLPWVAPVGRLDKASEGLLLWTNDSEWASRLLAPETHLDRIYHVQIDRLADAALTAALTRGIRDDGDLLRATSVRVLRGGEKNTWLEVVLEEGKNRHIRRMFDALGVEVLRLVRVAIGPLPLGDLPKSIIRPLTAQEKAALDRATRVSKPAQGRRRRRSRP
jgi:23S rRNA pseudouridine2605 synthase